MTLPATIPPHALIDFISPDADTPPLRAAFEAPVAVLSADTPDTVPEVLDAVQAHARAGCWCVGFVRYEAAPAFDAAFAVHPARVETPSKPLAWFGVFNAPRPWRREENETAIVDWHTQPEMESVRAAIADIHCRIHAGEVYQINHTARLRGTLRQGTPRALFAALQRAQPDTYAAFIDTGLEQALSVSPELFFDWRPAPDGSGAILSRPMKGTAARGATPAEDAACAAALQASAKERAENLMIVDLIRNDLSRIAEPHSVTVPRLFHTEALPTVWCMTSDVAARTKPGTTLAKVFKALFPCGSVTGAPKVQAMRVIRGLEPDARNLYCGAIGVVRPGGAATFNVAIRTVEITGSEIRCGIGSGITADANFADEWREWRHKAAFAERASAPFALLETLRIENGIACHAAHHLARMAEAAAHFRFPWNQSAVERTLADLAAAQPQTVRRARLLLHADGRIETQAAALDALRHPVKVKLAHAPLREAHGEFVRHKTTRRGHYAAFAPPREIFDTLLWNESGEITEFTRGNVAVRLGGRWLTPAASCGLLQGVGRALALADGRMTEGIIRREDLQHAEGIAFINSLRGWMDARLEGD